MNTLTLKDLTVAIALLLLSAVWSVQTNAADYSSAEFLSAYQNYMDVTNEQGSAKKLAKQWQEIFNEDDKDPLALVILGSSHTMMGRDALMPWSKMSNTEQGLDEMAMALRLLTDSHKSEVFQRMSVDLQVKTKAAITFSQVPSFFGRMEDGYYLFQDVLADPAFLAMPAPAQTYVYYYAITIAFELDEDQQAQQWQQALQAMNFADDYTVAALAME